MMQFSPLIGTVLVARSDGAERLWSLWQEEEGQEREERKEGEEKEVEFMCNQLTIIDFNTVIYYFISFGYTELSGKMIEEHTVKILNIWTDS